MKLLTSFMMLMIPWMGFSQSAIVTTTGIGEIRLGMTKTDLEKLTGQPVKLVKLLKKEAWERDTVNLVYKNVSYQVIMDRDYINEKSSGFIVYEVRSNSAALKTRSGISIGDDKLKIISTYNDYVIQIMPELEEDYKTRSKTRSTVWLHSGDGKLIIFYLTNNKVTGFCVMYDEGC